MKMLILDTSSQFGSVAISEDERVISELKSNVQGEYSSRLLPLIDLVLKESQTSIEEIELFVATIGPGSFTGLRIGLATIKGLTFKNKKPIVAISTLHAMAASAMGHKKIASIYDALRGNLYYGLFDTSQSIPVRLEQDVLIERKYFLSKVSEDFLVIGNGLNVVKSDLVNLKVPFKIDIQNPNARDMAAMGLFFYKNNVMIKDSISLEPVYLQEAAAKRNIGG